MKILICNFSGNMGKTTLAKHLLAPRMPDARIIVLESTNAGADELPSPIRIESDDFASLVDIMTLEDKLIVDLGSSEAKEMIRNLKVYESSVHDFDLIIVPTVADPKAMEDTITTVMTLNALGVGRDRIRVVFNKVPVHQAGKVEQLFSPLFHTIADMASLDPNRVIYQYEIYKSLKGSATTISDVMNDKNDWKAVARNSSQHSDEVRLDALQKHRNQKAAPPAQRNLDTVFARICD